MKCSVPGCKNDSRNTSKSKGITFHVFPNDPSLRNAWLQAVGKKMWEPKWRSAVCSEHFNGEDLYDTKNGLRKVRGGAVPNILPETSSCEDGKEDGTENLEVCRICLATDVRIVSMTKYNLYQAYQNVTDITPSKEDGLPQMLCWECAQKLINCSKFRNKSLRANTLMLELLYKEDRLTKQNIRQINRSINKLISNLSPKYFETNHFDVEINEYAEEVVPDAILEDSVKCKKENIKIEDVSNESIEIFIEEFKDVKTCINIEYNREDHVLPDKDYSTGDSLPLEVAKIKKEKVETKKVTRKVGKRAAKKNADVIKVDRRRKPFLNEDLNENLFTIHDLTVEEQIAEIDKRQNSSNYKNAVFKCTECYKGFLDEDAYKSHMSRHTVQCGEHRCSICKTHFKHPNALSKHITAYHSQRFSCNQCLYVTTHRQTAKLHMRWHKGTKYECPHCLEEFVKFTTYMGHIRIKHPSDFVCQLCGYSFVSEKGLILHKKLKHRLENVSIPEDGPYCELCNVRFISIEVLNRHMSVSAKHTGIGNGKRQPNKPSKLKKRNEREMDRRKKEDDDKKLLPNDFRKAEGPIPCEQCGMQLENSRAYHSHFRRYHPDKNRTNYPSMKSPCMCEVCGRMFRSYALLKDHRCVHTGEKPFKCDSCEKSFRMKQRLVAHKRVHSSEKATYGCSVCGKQFSTHSNRQRHMFIHTGLKPFKCEMCGKGFKHGSEKRAHITYVHLKKPWPKRSRGKRRSDGGRQIAMPNQHLQPPESELDLQPIWTCDPKTTIDTKTFDRTFETHPV